VALTDGAAVLAGASEPMQRGHQERLAPMTAEVMARAGVAFGEVGRIAVTIGPGSFTGLRVGLAFAKGLRLATGAQLAGIGTLEALAASAGAVPRAAGVVDARRGQVYLQAFAAGRALMAPEALTTAAAAAMLGELGGGAPFAIVGPGADLLAATTDESPILHVAAASLQALVDLAAAAEASADLRPLYLRAPDALPATP